MANVGLIEYNWENPTRTKQYVLPMFVPGSAEFFNMKWDNIVEHPQVANFFERMTQLPLEKITPMVPPGGAGIGMHVIPVEKAIEMENESASVEHISHWLDKYDGKYAAGPCSCRYSRAICGEGCADGPEDWCIGVGDMADYLVETNKGHYITREKVMEILQRAEDNGFVHQITNIDGENKIFAICNCQVKVCNALRTSQLFNTPNMSRSAYVARVEAKDCVACGRCVEYCPAGSVKLGQKLCTKDGGHIEYPKQELPDTNEWSEDKWSPDYRDKNRINCYDTGTAPCKTACPAHIAVQGYLKMASQGRYTDALALIKKENPFPAVCGRVCNRRCEDACTRGTIDQAVAIDEVKRFIAQQDLNADKRYIPKKVIPSNRGGRIQNRANTLALWCMYAQVFPLFLDDSKFSVLSSVYPEGYTTSMMVQGINPETVGAANPKAQAVISIIALVANVCILAAIIKRSVEQKKNPYKNEFFTDQKNYKDALLRAAEANREIA